MQMDSLFNIFRLCYSFPHLYMNSEYRVNNALEAVSLTTETEGSNAKDIGRELIAGGNALAEARREPRLQKLVFSIEYNEGAGCSTSQHCSD